MSEKRTHQRSPIELAASFGMPQEQGTPNEAKVKNVSEGGFCIYSGRRLKMGDLFELSVEYNDREDINVNVKVAWCREVEKGKFLVGVQIIETEPDKIEKFQVFYNQHMQKMNG